MRRLSTFSLASFHARWTGTIQGVDGRDYHLNEVYQLHATSTTRTIPTCSASPSRRFFCDP